MIIKYSKSKQNEIFYSLQWNLIASLSFHLLYSDFVALFPIYFYALIQLTKVKSIPISFMNGLIVGYSIYVFHLQFLIEIFQSFSFTLLTFLSLWIAVFLAISSSIRKCYSRIQFCLIIPFLYFAMEFTRCELNPLKFTWVIPGWSFADNAKFYFLNYLGVYGISYVTISIIIFLDEYIADNKRKFSLLIVLISLFQIPTLTTPIQTEESLGPRITGIQWEMASKSELLKSLDEAMKKFPDTELIFLSEYSFDEGIPAYVKQWCVENKVYLLAGTTETIKNSTSLESINHNIGGKNKQKPYFNMAMVVGPSGDVVFKQAKVMPIQFFNDGTAAFEQKLWNSPWGKIGIAICYDLSFSMITDELVRQGAQALFIPTMDVAHWGLRQRKLHGRIAPTRAIEYQIPIYRVCSSGISQFVDKKGIVQAMGSYPGQGDIISSKIKLSESNNLPMDRVIIYPIIFLTVISLINLLYMVCKKNAYMMQTLFKKKNE